MSQSAPVSLWHDLLTPHAAAVFQRPARNRLAVPAMFLGFMIAGCGTASSPGSNDSSATGTSAVLGQAGDMSDAFGESGHRHRPFAELSESERFDVALEALQPFHPILGEWRGTTQKEYGGFRAVETQVWMWDFISDPRQPALVMTTEASPYLRSGRLAYLIDDGVYEFTAVDAKGFRRVLISDAADPHEQQLQQGGRPGEIAPLELTEDSPPNGSEAWQLKLTSAGADHFKLDLNRRESGSEFAWFDTVSAERVAGSIAAEGTGTVHAMCIISQTPATIEVQYKGQSYWVCCAGCRDAFQEEPERWLAKTSEREESAPSRVSRR